MDKNKTSLNDQTGPHHEGQMNNKAQTSGNNSHSPREMMNDSEEQKAGRAHQQKESQHSPDQDAGGQLGNSSSSGTNK